ncbi:uncharacterized protein METZ01_LOCUS40526 [marine metagenome]|uniref:Uncharacterized protein n=1 Tax=marine metagenome TaxID=408172 RepID=A0A381R7M1_9ZZZZ
MSIKRKVSLEITASRYRKASQSIIAMQ